MTTHAHRQDPEHFTATERPQEDYDRIYASIVDNDADDPFGPEENALIDALLSEKPHQALIAMVDFMSRIYEERHVDEVREDGTVVTRFATRDTSAEPHRLDDMYMVTQKPNGSRSFSIQTMLFPDEGYGFHFDDMGNLDARVLQSTYDFGILRGSDRFKVALSDMLHRVLSTGRIAMKRAEEEGPEAAAAGHREARELLIARLAESPR